MPDDGVGIGGNTTLYRPPVDDFEVRVTNGNNDKNDYVVDSGVDSGSILLMLNGSCSVITGEEKVEMSRGEALFIAANSELTISDGSDDLQFVRAMRNLK